MTESDRIAHAEQLRLMEALYYPRALPADPVAECNQGERNEPASKTHGSK